jgi:hypothetical protein
LQKQIKNRGIKTGIFSMEGTPWVPNFIRKQSPRLLLIRSSEQPGNQREQPTFASERKTMEIKTATQPKLLAEH